MALLDVLAKELTGPKSVGVLSKANDADEGDVRKLVTAAVPILLGGMYQNSTTEDGASSLEKALGDHAPKAEKSTASMLSKADAEDGKKIVKHILGGDEKDIVRDLAKASGLTQKKTSSMLAQLAPVLMALVGANAGKPQETSASAGLLSMLGGAILGGGYQQQQTQQQQAQPQQGGISIASLAGALLGGQTEQSGGLGSLVGSLMGANTPDKPDKPEKPKKPKKPEKPETPDKPDKPEKEDEGGFSLSGLLMGLLK